jgi:3-methylfumaryl-CoA hydratase
MSGYEEWIGRTSRRNEAISQRQLELFRTTFDGFLAPADVPLGFHWTLVPDLAPSADLGRDGHPRTGLFWPALPLPRRMWAGGELEYLAPFAADDMVTRDSTITDISFKQGASGSLGFVTVDHVWSVGGKDCLRERQDVVYREDPKPGARPTPPPAESWSVERTRPLVTDSVLLFRYSAMTFNGHRIHYDEPYARTVEGYAGLVVHGPMQALLMLNLAAEMIGHVPARFGYRGVSPLIAGTAAVIEARQAGDGLELRVRTDDGAVTMTARARP